MIGRIVTRCGPARGDLTARGQRGEVDLISDHVGGKASLREAYGNPFDQISLRDAPIGVLSSESKVSALLTFIAELREQPL